MPGLDFDADEPSGASGASDAWREPVRGGHPDSAQIGLSGARQLRAMLDGDTPAPPMTRLMGTRLTEFGPGTATFELPLSGWLRAADGQIPLGPLAMAADAAMACAVISGLPERTSMTTTEMTLHRLRPIPATGRLLARARVVDPGPPLALAEVLLADEGGNTIAQATSLCLTIEVSLSSAFGVSAGRDGERPDPWQREPPDPDGARAPLTRLTGLRPLCAEHGGATYAMPATPWLCAPPPGRLQGGAVVMLAEAALTGAIETVAPAGAAFSPVEVKLNFLRPLASDGRPVRAHARVVNSGRRIIVATAEVRDAGERLIAVASGSSLAGASAAGS